MARARRVKRRGKVPSNPRQPEGRHNRRQVPKRRAVAERVRAGEGLLGIAGHGEPGAARVADQRTHRTARWVGSLRVPSGGAGLHVRSADPRAGPHRDFSRSAAVWPRRSWPSTTSCCGASPRLVPIRSKTTRRTCASNGLRRRCPGSFSPRSSCRIGWTNINRRIAGLLEQARIPVVLIDRDLVPFPERSQHDLVGIDNRRAAYVLTTHLIDAGRRRLAFVVRPRSAPTCVAGAIGFREALLDAAAVPPRVPSPVGEAGGQEAEARWSTPADLEASCVQIITPPAQLMRTLEELAIKVTDEIALAGFDDVKDASLPPSPSLRSTSPAAISAAAGSRAMISGAEFGLPLGTSSGSSPSWNASSSEVVGGYRGTGRGDLRGVGAGPQRLFRRRSRDRSVTCGGGTVGAASQTPPKCRAGDQNADAPGCGPVSNGVAKYRQIYESLKSVRSPLAGKDGQRLPSESELAKASRPRG